MSIPATTADERWRLFSASVGSILPSAALGLLKAFQSFLPDNPRRIKKLARALQLFTKALARHHLDEVDWTSLLFASLMRLESEEFFRRYRERVLDSYDERLAEGMARAEGERTEAQKKRISELLAQCNIPESQHTRLRELAVKWEAERSYYYTERITYTLRLVDRPDAFTWKEIDELVDAWSVPEAIDHVRQLVSAKVHELSYSSDAVVKELLESLHKKYHQHLERAADAFTRAEHARAIKRAEQILERLAAIAFDRELVTADNRFVIFSGLLASVHTWGHFTSNSLDAELRASEVSLLTKLVDERGEKWGPYASKLRPDRFGERRKEFNELVGMLAAKCSEAAAESVLLAFNSAHGIAQLLKNYELDFAHTQLCSATSELWISKGEPGPLLELLKQANSNEVVQQNAHALLRYAEGHGELNLGVAQDALVGLVSAETVGVALWNAAIGQEIQYRMLRSTRSIRRFLVKRGIAPEKLAHPEWLNAGEAADEIEQ